jgi:hypothetical protein
LINLIANKKESKTGDSAPCVECLPTVWERERKKKKQTNKKKGKKRKQELES